MQKQKQRLQQQHRKHQDLGAPTKGVGASARPQHPPSPQRGATATAAATRPRRRASPMAVRRQSAITSVLTLDVPTTMLTTGLFFAYSATGRLLLHHPRQSSPPAALGRGASSATSASAMEPRRSLIVVVAVVAVSQTPVGKEKEAEVQPAAGAGSRQERGDLHCNEQAGCAYLMRVAGGRGSSCTPHWKVEPSGNGRCCASRCMYLGTVHSVITCAAEYGLI